MHQQKIPHDTMEIPCVTTKTRRSQIKKAKRASWVGSELQGFRSDGKGVGRGAVRMRKNKGGPEVKGIWPIKRFSATVTPRRRSTVNELRAKGLSIKLGFC